MKQRLDMLNLKDNNYIDQNIFGIESSLFSQSDYLKETRIGNMKIFLKKELDEMRKEYESQERIFDALGNFKA